MNVNGTVRVPSTTGFANLGASGARRRGIRGEAVLHRQRRLQDRRRHLCRVGAGIEPARLCNVFLLEGRIRRLSPRPSYILAVVGHLSAALLCRARSRFFGRCARSSNCRRSSLISASARCSTSSCAALPASGLGSPLLRSTCSIRPQSTSRRRGDRWYSDSGGRALLAFYALLRSEDRRVPRRARNDRVDCLRVGCLCVLAADQAASRGAAPVARRLCLRGSTAAAGRASSRAPLAPVRLSSWLSWLSSRSIREIRSRRSRGFSNATVTVRNVYPYNSVNAFNLWGLRGTLWVPDSQNIPSGGFRSICGASCSWSRRSRWSSGATCKTVRRHALMEGCAIAALAFFVLATRTHDAISSTDCSSPSRVFRLRGAICGAPSRSPSCCLPT